MWQKGLEPNVIRYNAAISACEETKQSLYALELLKGMRREYLEANLITYSADISA